MPIPFPILPYLSPFTYPLRATKDILTSQYLLLCHIDYNLLEQAMRVGFILTFWMKIIVIVRCGCWWWWYDDDDDDDDDIDDDDDGFDDNNKNNWTDVL